MPVKLLLVEDDPNLGMVLQEYLQLKGGYEVRLCTDGEQGLKAFHQEIFDLCIFDVMMPKVDGFTLAKNLREINSDIPILFATAKSMMEDKTAGFTLGGDDYITKPFRIEELLLRINALLRRRTPAQYVQEKSQFRIGKYSFDYSNFTLSTDGQEIHLSAKEAELLRLLCLHNNSILKREEALLKIWKDDSYFNGRSMDVYLSKLRKYLKDDPSVMIMNVHGKGFKLVY